MSRVSSKPVELPKGVEVKLEKHMISIKGPKGQLSCRIHPRVTVELKKDESAQTHWLQCGMTLSSVSQEAEAIAGTTRALIQNMVSGVSKGFEKQLELVGVGYRAQAKGKQLQLSVGYSHPVIFPLPDQITAETPSNTSIVLRSSNKQLLGQVAAEIRAIRPPEPYKGKGIRYTGEVIKQKETKKK